MLKCSVSCETKDCEAQASPEVTGHPGLWQRPRWPNGAPNGHRPTKTIRWEQLKVPKAQSSEAWKLQLSVAAGPCNQRFWALLVTRSCCYNGRPQNPKISQKVDLLLKAKIAKTAVWHQMFQNWSQSCHNNGPLVQSSHLQSADCLRFHAPRQHRYLLGGHPAPPCTAGRPVVPATPPVLQNGQAAAGTLRSWGQQFLLRWQGLSYEAWGTVYWCKQSINQSINPLLIIYRIIL